MSATVAPIGISCHAGRCYSSLMFQFDKTIDCFPAWQVPGFQISSSLNLLLTLKSVVVSLAVGAYLQLKR